MIKILQGQQGGQVEGRALRHEQKQCDKEMGRVWCHQSTGCEAGRAGDEARGSWAEVVWDLESQAQTFGLFKPSRLKVSIVQINLSPVCLE